MGSGINKKRRKEGRQDRRHEERRKEGEQDRRQEEKRRGKRMRKGPAGEGGGVCLKYVRIIPLKNWANNIKILQQKQQILKQFDISRQFLNRRKRQYWKKAHIYKKTNKSPNLKKRWFFYFLRGVILRVRFVRNAVTIKLTSLFREWCTWIMVFSVFAHFHAELRIPLPPPLYQSLKASLFF